MQKSDMFWLGSFGLGFLFSYAVGFIPAGLGLFLFFNAALYAIWKLSKNNPHRAELEATAISTGLVKAFMGVFVLFTLPYLYRYDPSIISLLVMFHLVLLVLLLIVAVLPGALHIIDLFALFITPFSVGLTWIIESFKSVSELFKGNSNVVKFMLKFILYAAASLAVFIIFANLLSQADAEFQKRIQSILESLKLSEVMLRTGFGVILSFIAAGILSIVGYFNLLPLMGSTQERAKKQWEIAFSHINNKRSDALLPLIITIPVVLLFGLYVWIQVKYFFGVDMQQILERFSFAEYARRGFVELLVTGALTYPVLAWTMNRAKSEWIVPRVANFAVNTGIVALLVIMLYSLIFRMNLYMSAYGPSVLRSYVIIGAVVVAISLLAYEVAAILKLRKAGYSFMHALIFGDYSVIAFFAGISILGAISFVPWNTVVATQIGEEYSRSKKIDVFQLVQLAEEAQPTVYAIAGQLEAAGNRDGANILITHALDVRDDYAKARNSSLFTNIFGFNIAGNEIAGISSKESTAAIEKAAKDQLSSHAKSIVTDYLSAISANDFSRARTFYDPQMKSNDIKGFSENVSLGTISVRDCDCYALTNNLGFDRNVSVSATAVISRVRTFDPKLDIVSGTGLKPITTTRKETINIRVTLGIRNGKLVIVDSNIILAYLPDAVAQQNNTNSSFSSYGYSRYCETPNLRDLYAPSSSCNGSTSSYPKLPKIPFLESDFETVSK